QKSTLFPYTTLFRSPSVAQFSSAGAGGKCQSYCVGAKYCRTKRWKPSRNTGTHIGDAADPTSLAGSYPCAYVTRAYADVGHGQHAACFSAGAALAGSGRDGRSMANG